MWSPVRPPLQTSGGLLIEVGARKTSQSPDAWIVRKHDGFYYKLFVYVNSPLIGPFLTIAAARLACEIAL